MPRVVNVELIVGLEVHVELATRTKMFSRAPNPAYIDSSAGDGDAAGAELAPNSCIDPVVLGLPGALPVMNKAAVELSMMVGMALGCTIAERSVWDRKSYFYPDMPKNYQLSQYPLPLCFDGSVELPPVKDDGEIDWDAAAASDARPGRRIGIIRAHLEEDAGKLMHEAPGGIGELTSPGSDGEDSRPCSIVDLNRAGTPLLEIVTQPDFRSAGEVVAFAQLLRTMVRFLGASRCVMQKGHIRFEPNINTVLTLDDGRTVRTPIVEVKNLNSFKAVRGAIDYECAEQPERWLRDGREMGPGTKVTRGWDDNAMRTVPQREKEDAHDYRYFPEPDLVPVMVDERWRERVRARIPELPLTRAARYIREHALSPREAAALTEEREVCLFFESSVSAAVEAGVEHGRAGRAAANLLLQSGAKRCNERTAARQAAAAELGRAAGGVAPTLVHELGIPPRNVGQIAALREQGSISAAGADELFGLLCGPEPRPPEIPNGWVFESPGRGGSQAIEGGPPADAVEVAQRRGMLIVRDAAALDGWCKQVIGELPKVADDVRAGKLQAVGRLVGAAMKLAGGQADAKDVRAKLLEMLGVRE